MLPFVSNGVKVYLSGGDPTWINSGSLPAAFTQMVSLVNMSGRIDGIQLDLEVHTHANWNSNRPDVIDKTMAFMTSARTATSGMIFGNIIHPSYASTTINPLPNLPAGYGTGNLADGIIASSDHLIVLGFRNTVSGLLTFNTNLLAALDRNRKTWTFGITFNGGQTFTYISYADRGAPWSDAQTDMLALRSAVNGRPAEPFLEGTAVQAYKLLQPYSV